MKPGHLWFATVLILVSSSGHATGSALAPTMQEAHPAGAAPNKAGNSSLPSILEPATHTDYRFSITRPTPTPAWLSLTGALLAGTFIALRRIRRSAN